MPVEMISGSPVLAACLISGRCTSSKLAILIAGTPTFISRSTSRSENALEKNAIFRSFARAAMGSWNSSGSAQLR